MSKYTIFTDKDEDFQCTVEIKGGSEKNSMGPFGFRIGWSQCIIQRQN